MNHKILFLILCFSVACINVARASDYTPEQTNYIDDNTISTIRSEIQDLCPECFQDCPFNTQNECDVWYTKPINKESVNPRSFHLNQSKFNDILYSIKTNHYTSANDSVFSPLIERYNILMRASKSCCTAGVIRDLQNRNSTDEEIYTFLKTDANHFVIGAKCLIMSDNSLEEEYLFGITDKTVKNIRTECLCKNKQWFNSLITPFIDIYKEIPTFEQESFNYTYTDGLNRQITTSVNEDIQNVIKTLSKCPK